MSEPTTDPALPVEAEAAAAVQAQAADAPAYSIGTTNEGSDASFAYEHTARDGVVVWVGSGPPTRHEFEGTDVDFTTGEDGTVTVSRGEQTVQVFAPGTYSRVERA